jgi:general secretion pathway protein D
MVQMQFDNIELRDLIKFVSNIMGKNFIFDDNVVKGKATILSPKSLTRDEVFRVFESVLNYYGFSVVQTPEAIKIVKSADAKTLAIESLDPVKVMNLPPEERVATLVQPLEYLDSNTMVGIMRPLMSRDAYLVSVPATNSLIMIDAAANLQRLKKLVAELDIPVSKQLSAINVYNVQHTTAADLAKTLQALLAEGKKAVTPKDKIFITSYAPTNSLLVSAPPEDMKDIRRIIEEIDTLRPQVLVEAAIMEVSLTKGASLGVEWVAGGTSGNTAIIGGVLNPSGALAATAAAIVGGDPAAAAAAIGSNLTGFHIGVVGGDITFNGKTYPGIGAFVKAVASESNVNILSTPQILTMNNEEAEIVVGENRPYITSSRLDSAGNPINSFDYRDVGVKLKVKPYINKDGLVYLTLYQEVTKVTEATVGSGTAQQPAPTTLKRSTKTTVGIKDSQTIVISGLIKDDSDGRRQGIPFLSAIPGLGFLFGTQSRAVEKTNLLVFITPRIIYSSEKIEEISRQMKTEQQKLIDREKATKPEKMINTE